MPDKIDKILEKGTLTKRIVSGQWKYVFTPHDKLEMGATQISHSSLDKLVGAVFDACQYLEPEV